MTLSICIPTYQRGRILSSRIREWLSTTVSDNFELLVLDNASPDGSYERLSSIDDPRLKVCRNKENVGSWENIAKVLGMGSGKYSMILTDKDVIDLGRIGEILSLLSDVDAAAGRFVPDAKAQDAKISCRTYTCMHGILLNEGLKFSHPSGYFFRSDILKNEEVFGRLRRVDPVFRPYSTDFQVLLMAGFGPFAVVEAPLVYLQLPPFEGVSRSFTYREGDDLFFMPQYLFKVFALYVNMMRAQGVGFLTRCKAADRMVKLLYALSTDGYISVLAKDNICDWYGLSREFRERQSGLPLAKDFLMRFFQKSGIAGADKFIATILAVFRVWRAQRRVQKKRKEII